MPRWGNARPDSVDQTRTYATKTMPVLGRKVRQLPTAVGHLPSLGDLRRTRGQPSRGQRPTRQKQRGRSSLKIWRAGFLEIDPVRNLPEFVSLPGFRKCAVGDKSDEFRIPFIAQVAQGAPEFHRPRMFMFDERRKSLGASFKELPTYFAH